MIANGHDFLREKKILLEQFKEITLRQIEYFAREDYEEVERLFGAKQELIDKIEALQGQLQEVPANDAGLVELCKELYALNQHLESDLKDARQELGAKIIALRQNRQHEQQYRQLPLQVEGAFVDKKQ